MEARRIQGSGEELLSPQLVGGIWTHVPQTVHPGPFPQHQALFLFLGILPRGFICHPSLEGTKEGVVINDGLKPLLARGHKFLYPPACDPGGWFVIGVHANEKALLPPPVSDELVGRNFAYLMVSTKYIFIEGGIEMLKEPGSSEWWHKQCMCPEGDFGWKFLFERWTWSEVWRTWRAQGDLGHVEPWRWPRRHDSVRKQETVAQWE